jgi:hypothetical protein
MDITSKPRQYLHDILDDDGFDIRHVEDFDAWTREEYEILAGYADADV